jgi:hypothetical protein
MLGSASSCWAAAFWQNPNRRAKKRGRRNGMVMIVDSLNGEKDRRTVCGTV